MSVKSRKKEKKQNNFEQNSRLHMDGDKIAICESPSNTLLVINSAFTTKDNYFRTALDDEDCYAINAALLDFGYTQKLEAYDPHRHQVSSPNKDSFY